MSETDDDTDETGTESGSIPKSRSSSGSSIRRLHRPRRRRYERVRYTHILNSHIEDSLSPIDSFTLPKHTRPKHSPFILQDSTILNTFWTTDEKNRFFTALARCGKGNLSEVARRVGTKSLVEVTAYVGVLDDETTKRKLSTLRPVQVYDYSKVPAAVEMDDQWIAFEDRMAAEMGRKTDDETTLEDTQDDEEMLLNIDKANELAIWLLSSHYFWLLANKRYQNALVKPGTIRPKSLNPRNHPSILSPKTTHTLNTHIKTLTTRLLRTVLFLTQTQYRSSARPAQVTVSIARTAIDILGLPRHFARHFATLPRRLDVPVRNANRRGKKVMELESVEEMLAPNKSKVDRRRSNTPLPWPEEWDRRNGFEWPVQGVESVGRRNTVEDSDSEDDEEDDDDGEEWFEGRVPEGFKEESDSDVPGIPDEFTRESISPDPPPRRGIDMHEAQDILLDTETTYLDALDAQSSQIELNKLNQHIKHGVHVSRRKYKSAVAGLSSADIDRKRRKWKSAVRRQRRLHGYEWAQYSDEILDVEGRDWDVVEEWETCQKIKRNGDENVGRLKRGRSEECFGGRKRRVISGATSVVSGVSTLSDEDSEMVDYSALDTDSD